MRQESIALTHKSCTAVFVHGLFSGPDIWLRMISLLRSDQEITSQFDLLTFSYWSPLWKLSPFRRIPDLGVIADSLTTYLAEALSDYRRVVLVGHSQGGLVIQRYLAKALADGKGEELARIRRIVLFACPNSGSEFLLTLRKCAPFWQHIQERGLRPLNEDVSATTSRVLNSIVHATSAAPDRCPIPIVAYAGEEDGIVPPHSARGSFPEHGGLPGDHFSIIQPTSDQCRRFLAIRRNLLIAAKEPMPRVSDWRRKDERANRAGNRVYSEPKIFPPVSIELAEGLPPLVLQVHGGPVDRIANVDIIVSSENVYFEMAKPYKPSTSGRLRYGAAKKNEAGEIVDDVMFNELNTWLRSKGKHGLQVALGTVAPTSPGELAKQGVKRIYHAAIVTPVIGSNDYTVDPEAIRRATKNIFNLARAERASLGLSLSSICLPLFGSGRGKMDPEESFSLIWSALKTEHAADQSWTVHFATWTVAETEVLLGLLKQLQENPGWPDG